MTCDKCGSELVVGSWPFCPHGVGHATVVDDSLDHWQKNGTQTPIHFTSKSDRKAWLKATGQEEFVRHVENPATGKSAHTTDWSKMTDPYTMGYKRELLERAFKQRPTAPVDDTIHFRPFDDADLAQLDKQFNSRH